MLLIRRITRDTQLAYSLTQATADTN